MRRLALLLALATGAAPRSAHAAKGAPKAEAPSTTKGDKTDKSDTSDASTEATSDGGDKDDSAKADDESDSKSDSKSSSDSSSDDIQRVDGVDACRLFRDANNRERAMWEKTRPATPYVYPSRDTVVDAPWGEFLKATAHSGLILTATLVPHLNAALRSLSPEPGLSWPWSISLGPAMTCSRDHGSFDVDVYRPVRLLLEPGFFVGDDHTVAFFVRPGARFMVHPSSWVVGLGGGLGTMIELSGKEPTRASLSPEGVLQLGHCCNPGYVTLAVRRDFFFAGRTQIWAATVGFTYF